jgi:hypothetical protein
MIHGPSLAIGAGIASISIIIVFLALDGIMDEPKLIIEQPSVTQETTSTNIVSNTFTANGSPILGDPDAPITLIEFGDYQCHFCNVHFHNTEHNLLENYIETGKVKMIFKDFTIIGPDSINAAHGAHCATQLMVPTVQMTKESFGNIMIFYTITGLEKITDGLHRITCLDLHKKLNWMLISGLTV